MKIAILAAGAGDMYCGSCLRDASMAVALKRLGHDVSLIPLYTPLRTDSEDISSCEVFYGGVNVYLQHASAFFRHTPRAIDWILDRGWLLRAAGNWGAQTMPDDVAELTAAILEAETGPARKELHRLLEFLKNEVRPHIVSLPNLMFVGLARVIRDELRIPVLCELTGEDIFLDAMSEPNRERVRSLIRSRAGDVTRFVSTTGYYARKMADYLGIPAAQIEVIPTSVSADMLAPMNSRAHASTGAPTVGYFARICPEKGLDRLVEAMLLLKKKSGFEHARLKVGGYLGPRDKKWFETLQTRVAQSALRDSFDFLGTVDRAAKIEMLDSIDVFSVPTSYPEAKGIYVLEAMARGIPVVLPAHGSFPEIIELSGGGLQVTPADSVALADALAGVLGDPALRERLSRSGRAAAELHFVEDKMAARMLELYQSLL